MTAVTEAPAVADPLAAAAQLLRAGRAEAAAEHCRGILADRPDDPAALGLLGAILATGPDAGEGIALLRRAVALAPAAATHRTNLGLALQAAGQLEEAERVLRQAVALDPDQPRAQGGLGAVLLDRGRFAAAVAQLRGALAAAPHDPALRANLGTALKDLGRVEEGVAQLRGAARLAPTDGEIAWNLAVALLTLRQDREAWQAFEARRHRPSHRLATPPGPEWDGDPATAAGRTLLVTAEQGRGDTLQFVRFLPRLAATGARLVLACQQALVRLRQRVEGVAAVTVKGEPLSAYDLHCPLLSLPAKLGLDLPDLGMAAPYLAADPVAVTAWRAALPADGLRVGLVWGGAPGNPIDARRSLPPEALAPLAAVPGVRFVSLQLGRDPEPLARVLPLYDPTAQLADFADTAALVAALDLVVGVDTAVVHLAGGLGRPVWLLNRFDSCWRWGRTGDDSHWYPTLRQFRQTTPGDWSGPVARLADALHAHAAAGKP